MTLKKITRALGILLIAAAAGMAQTGGGATLVGLVKEAFDDRLKVSLRLDGHNLPWKHPNLAAPNTTYNLNSVTSFARFTGVLGDFSNFGTGQANVQASIRVEF